MDDVRASNLSRIDTMRSCSSRGGIGILNSFTIESEIAGYAEPL